MYKAILTSLGTKKKQAAMISAQYRCKKIWCLIHRASLPQVLKIVQSCTEVYFLHWQNDTRYKVIDL